MPRERGETVDLTVYSSRPMLRAKDVNKRFGKRTVLCNQSLEVMSGEAVAIVGENGAGKSTLL
jgi:ABC-type sugar transport system ATPase subunit